MVVEDTVHPEVRGELLGWGSEWEECGEGIGQYTAGIVKLDNGEIRMVPAAWLRVIE